MYFWREIWLLQGDDLGITTVKLCVFKWKRIHVNAAGFFEITVKLHLENDLNHYDSKFDKKKRIVWFSIVRQKKMNEWSQG